MAPRRIVPVRIHRFAANGEHSVYRQEPDAPLTWTDLTEYTAMGTRGDLLELVHVVFNDLPSTLVVNEEGLVYNLPPNRLASMIAQTTRISQVRIVGNAWLFEGCPKAKADYWLPKFQKERA